jgi:hypothetical protein
MWGALPLRPAMRTTGSFQTMAASGPGTAVSVRAQRVVSCDRGVCAVCVSVCVTLRESYFAQPHEKTARFQHVEPKITCLSRAPGEDGPARDDSADAQHEAGFR